MLAKSGDPHSARLFGAAPHEGLHIVSEAPYYKPWWGVALTIVLKNIYCWLKWSWLEPRQALDHPTTLVQYMHKRSYTNPGGRPDTKKANSTRKHAKHKGGVPSVKSRSYNHPPSATTCSRVGWGLKRRGARMGEKGKQKKNLGCLHRNWQEIHPFCITFH